MSDSLRDQLLKAGFKPQPKPEPKPASAAAAKGPRRDDPRRQPDTRPGASQNNRAQPKKQVPQHGKPVQPHQARPSGPKSGNQEPNLAHAYALRAKQEKEEREAAQREAERMAQEKRERKQKLSSLLANKALNAQEADTPRHFPHGNKIRRVYCTAEQLVKLNRGELAVVQLAGRYLLVERDIALQAQAIDAAALVLLCDPDAPTEDDVPPDLVW
jgi:uncharacterized protein YaiL (DUF2058 family)